MADQQLQTVQQQKLSGIRKMLEAMKPQMMMVLADPRHVETITRVALTSIQRNPDLLDCDSRSLMGAIMQACQLGLEPDDVRGLAYLVPFKKRVTLIPGYGGILFLALQTEGVQDIYARLVHANDEFQVDYGSDTLTHKPAKGERGEVIGGYYVIVYTTGYRRFGGGKDGGVMWREELDEIRKQALANKRDPNNPDLPWNRDWEQMAWKTLIRRSGKGLPKNSRLATAIRLDEQAERGIPQHLEMLVDTNALAEDQKKAEEANGPTTAPRKSAKGAADTQKSPDASAASGVGSSQDSGSTPAASNTPPTGTVPDGSLFGKGEPNGKITAVTLEKLVEKMSRWDKEHGSKVAMAAMKDRYKVAAVSALTEAQAQEFNELLNSSLGLPEGE